MLVAWVGAHCRHGVISLVPRHTIRYDTIWSDTVYLHALRSWRDGQLNPASAQHKNEK